ENRKKAISYKCRKKKQKLQNGKDPQFHLLHHSLARCLVDFSWNPEERGDVYEVLRRSHIGESYCEAKCAESYHESCRGECEDHDHHHGVHLTNDHDDHCHCYGRY
ncbi:unnamed protein product, partial [Brassica rapa subsp. trilocularis]